MRNLQKKIRKEPKMVRKIARMKLRIRRMLRIIRKAIKSNRNRLKIIKVLPQKVVKINIIGNKNGNNKSIEKLPPPPPVKQPTE